MPCEGCDNGLARGATVQSVRKCQEFQSAAATPLSGSDCQQTVTYSPVGWLPVLAHTTHAVTLPSPQAHMHMACSSTQTHTRVPQCGWN
jgi:hypothetical protein